MPRLVIFSLCALAGFASAAALLPYWATPLAGLILGASYLPFDLIRRGIRSPQMIWSVLRNRSNIPGNAALAQAIATLGGVASAIIGHIAAEFALPRMALPVTDFPPYGLIALGAGIFISLRLAKRFL